MTKFLHRGDEKKKLVQEMFDEISNNYDLLNHFLSFGIDKYWRKQFLRELPIRENYTILDVATGTGDIGFEIRKKFNCHITGLDCSSKMLSKAKEKLLKYKIKNFEFIQGDAESLPFDNKSFDIITIAYGFRNFGNFNSALNEFYRVLKPNGILGILEFSQSKSKVFSYLFNFYFQKVLPQIGKLISGSDAYKYLPESVSEFVTRDELINHMKKSGFIHCSIKDLTYGITSIFIGNKK